MIRNYRILLVDDEEEVRTAILHKMDWEQLGFTVVGDAENGQDALEQVELLDPDLVLTDIRMPYMDGLTLAATLQAQYPSIKVIFFSGYDDFSYAKEAIKRNVLEYILKPVNQAELAEILQRVRQKLDNELTQLRDVNALRESFYKNLPILKENFLDNLIHSRLPAAKIPMLLRDYQLNLGEANHWTVAQVSVEERGGADEEPSLLTVSVRHLIDARLRDRFVFASFFHSAGHGIVIGMEQPEEISVVLMLLHEICRDARRILEKSITIGVGQPVEALSLLETSYKEAKEAVGYRALADTGEVIYLPDVEPTAAVTLSFDAKAENDLLAILKFGDKEQIEAKVGEISAPLRTHRLPKHVSQTYIIGIVNALLRTVQRYELEPAELFEGETDYYAILLRLQDADSLAGWLEGVCLRIAAQLTDERADSTKKLLREAKQFMQENFADSTLSLESVCQQLHISTAYFSSVFKREAGESYTAYLTRIRLEKAAELLLATDEKTYLIAKAVGYEEPNYFGYVFKKQYGVSPNKYRGKQ